MIKRDRALLEGIGIVAVLSALFLWNPNAGLGAAAALWVMQQGRV